MVTLEPPVSPAEVFTVPEPVAPVTRLGGAQRKFLLGRDQLKLDGLDDQQRDDVEWLWSYCQARDLSRTQLEALVHKANGKGTYSYDSIYQLFTGRRVEAGADVDPVCTAIAEFRRQVDTVPAKDGFRETRLAKQLWNYAHLARDRQAVGVVVGNFTVGKTTAYEQLDRKDPKVVYVRMPTRGHLGPFLKGMARKLAMGDRQTVLDLSERIISSFKPGMVLVVDEADQCFSAAKNSLGLATLDFLRELWDRARCGIVLVMDSHGRDEMRNGPHKQRLQRLWRRRLPVLQLPEVPYAEDLALFAEGYGLPPAPDEKVRVTVSFTDAKGEAKTRTHEDSPLELQRRVLADTNGGLFVWLLILAEARQMARDQRRAVSWAAVIKAHAVFADAETYTGEEAP